MTFPSPTQVIPDVTDVPRHVAIIMDGNGRWATNRFMPRVAGHKRGVEAVRETVKACGDLGIEYLTLFAFSSENWRRPQDEVSVLMQLFLRALEGEVAKLHENNIRFKVIGDIAAFDRRIQDKIAEGQALTANNSELTLTVAANYGGRWDILQAINKVRQQQAISGKNAANAAPELVIDAVHVHHGLSPNADGWASFCQAECDRRGIPLTIVRVHIDRNQTGGQGIESAARRARYAAFSGQGAAFILAGQHADDQA